MKTASWLRMLVVAALLAVATSAQAASLMIDDFISPSGGQVQSASGGGSNVMVATTGGSDIIGSARVAQINSLEAGAVTIFINGAGGDLNRFTYSSAAALGWSLIEWDGDTALGLSFGLGNKDLTVGGSQNALEFYVSSLDWASTAIFTVYTDADEASKYTLNIPGGTVNTSFLLPYASFVDAGLGGGAANFANVNAMQFRFNAGTVDTDLKVDFIQTGFVIPEPSTWMLLAGGLSLMTLRRRRA